MTTSVVCFCVLFHRLYFSDPHPVFAVELMRVGKLQHYLEHTTAAMDTFKQVKKKERDTRRRTMHINIH